MKNPTDLRCAKKLHGVLKHGVLEVQCGSRFCKPSPGVVVIHRWDVTTGAPLPDELFREPFPQHRKE